MTFLCWKCLAEFTLRGSAPRLTITGVVLETGTDRQVISALEASWQAALCPECAVANRDGIAAIEREARA